MTMTEAEVVPQVVYAVNGTLYLPSYSMPGVFVGPGYGYHNERTYSGYQLMQMGALPRTYPLWMASGRREVR